MDNQYRARDLLLPHQSHVYHYRSLAHARMHRSLGQDAHLRALNLVRAQKAAPSHVSCNCLMSVGHFVGKRIGLAMRLVLNIVVANCRMAVGQSMNALILPEALEESLREY